MKKQLSITLLFLFVSLFTFSQERNIVPDTLIKKTIVSVDSTNFSVGDFVWFYTKYHKMQVDGTLSFNDFVNKFVEYRLKVAEAEFQQLDTSVAFREEFFRYIKLTANDRIFSGVEQKRTDLIRLEYDRLQWDYELAHIFINSNKFASPADTLEAWNRLQLVQNELRSGKSFAQCAQEFSDDNLSKNRGGNVGYITAMISPWEYENAVYNSVAGNQLTVRTAEGWYVIQVLNKRQTKGAFGASAILVYPQTETTEDWNIAKLTIDTVYSRLQNGESFEDLSSQYNLNSQLNETNGSLGLVFNGLPYDSQIKETLFALQNDGDYSQPIKLPFAYAVVKRRSHLPSVDFEDYQNIFKWQIASDKSRTSAVDNEYYAKLKKQLDYQENRTSLESLLQFVDNSILLGKWTIPDFPNDKVLFTILGENYFGKDFFEYLQSVQQQIIGDVYDKDVLVRMHFENFVERRLEFVAMEQLKKNDREFQYTMQEYHDGMIVYELLKREVEQAAREDSVGLKFFYNQHKEMFYSTEFTASVSFEASSVKDFQKMLKLVAQQDLWYKSKGTVKLKNADKIKFYDQKCQPQMFVVNSLNIKNKQAVKVSNDSILKAADEIPAENSFSYSVDEGNKRVDVTYYKVDSYLLPYEKVEAYLLAQYQKELERLLIKSLYKRHLVQIDNNTVQQLKPYLDEN